MAVLKNYWWKDDPEIGIYKFCHNENGDYAFSVDEVSVRYNYGWTEDERQRRFEGAKFTFGGCAGGCSYHRLMKAENIEDAKKEFEAWYEEYLAGIIEGYEQGLVRAREEYEWFLAYKKEARA